MAAIARRTTLSDTVFDKLWRGVTDRTANGVITVQDRQELEYVYNLTRGCTSYLEVGTAEGNSLSVMAEGMSKVVCVDLCEKHTAPKLKQIWKSHYVMIPGNSHDINVIKQANYHAPYEVVMIDAGHTTVDVIADACAYAPLATKYILFHDVQLKEVAVAFDWISGLVKAKKNYKFINSETFGYGVIEL